MSFLGFGQKSPDEIREMISNLQKEIREIDWGINALKKTNKNIRNAQFDASNSSEKHNWREGRSNFRMKRAVSNENLRELEKQKKQKQGEINELTRALNISLKKM